MAESRDKAFTKRLSSVMCDGMLSMALALGHELHLFGAMADVSSEAAPATAKQIAQNASLKERYVKEWLGMMACNDIIEVDETGERFWIEKDRVSDLSGPSMNPAFLMHQQTPMIGQIYRPLTNVMRIGGPRGLDNDMFDDFHTLMASFTEARHPQFLISDYLPLTGMKDKLEAGGLHVLDVGCGTGVDATHFAKHFPNSLFTGIDISSTAVLGANKRREEATVALDNLSFMEMNAQHMNKDWTDKFDWVTMFDSCHDQTRPDLSLKEIHRVLKPGALLSMIEVDGAGNIYKDKRAEFSKFIYGASLFHCLPVGSDSEDALCLGATWGRERAQKLILAAGFSKVDVVPTPFFEHNVLYLCYK